MTVGPATGIFVIVTTNRTAAHGFDATWWVRGVALHERAVGSAVGRSTRGEPAESLRLTRWAAAYGTHFGARLAESGLDEAKVLGLMTESSASVAARITRPDWADTAERAVAAAESLPQDEQLSQGWQDAFATVLRPFVTDATNRVLAQVVSGVADIDAVAGQFAAELGRRLAEIAARTLVRELHETRGELLGDDSHARFADFVRRMTAPARLAALLATYPVLARLLGQVSRFAADAWIELLSRFAADRAEIVEHLLAGIDPGLVVTIESGLGDAHRQGRSVTILSFAGRTQVVYKPRDLGTHVRFNAMVGWLNQTAPRLGLRTAAVVAKAGYGWSEFVAATPLADLAAADRFYLRQGALLALLHAVHAADIHCENLIASGDQPVVVDPETLFHPTLPGPDAQVDPAARALAESVYRTSLLPMIVVGEHGAVDMSGLGGDRGGVAPASKAGWEFPATDQMRLTRAAVEFTGAANRPRLADRDLDPCDHEPALIEGFQLGYDAVTSHQTEFSRLVEECADLEARVIVRPTRGYETLLDESTHPDVLRDALDRDLLFDLLWTEAAGQPARWRLSRHELADMWAGDVPLFTGRPGRRDVWTSDGHQVPDVLESAVLDQVRAKIAGQGEADRRDQEWIISATLATRRPHDGHVSALPLPGPVEVTAAQPERLLAAACGIADQIVARSTSFGDRVNWLGLELVDERQWLLLPAGAGLANGYTGIALFLSQLADLTGIAHYGDVARRAVTAVPQLFGALAGQPALVAAIGCGGYHGFGGIAFGLARMATLLASPELARLAESAVDFAATATGTAAGWAHGVAGCLAAMTAVHAELGTPAAASLAEACADHLVQLVEQGEVRGAGFAEGGAGIGLALARFGGADSSYGRAGRNAVAASADVDHDGWCSGRAGLLAAQSSFVDDAGLAEAVHHLAARSVLRDLSLCHGELGIVEALAAVVERNPAAATVRRSRAGLLLDAINRYGPLCGTPNGVPTPGLLAGLSGIGYGLLRLGFPDRVPSVLMLEPGPRKK